MAIETTFITAAPYSTLLRRSASLFLSLNTEVSLGIKKKNQTPKIIQKSPIRQTASNRQNIPPIKFAGYLEVGVSANWSPEVEG